MAFNPISAPDLKAWFPGNYSVYAQLPLPSQVMAGAQPTSWINDPEAISAWQAELSPLGYIGGVAMGDLNPYVEALKKWLAANQQNWGTAGRRTVMQEKEYERAMRSLGDFGTALRGVHGDPNAPSVYSWWEENPDENRYNARGGYWGNPLVRQMSQQAWSSVLPGVIRAITPEPTQENVAFPGAKPLADYLAGIGYRLGERKA